MPDPTINVNIPADTWTQAAEGPCEALVTPHDPVNFAYAASAPAPGSVIGHYRARNDDIVAVLESDMSLWVFSRGAGTRLSVTVESE